MRHHRLCGLSGSGAGPRRGVAPAGVSRLRQRRRGDLDRLPFARPQARRPHRRVGRSPDTASRRPAASASATRRWATHGAPTDRNAHPHVGGNGRVAVVHNGVIENYAALKSELQEQGVIFHSDTDTEVIVHLIARHLDGDLAEAVQRVLPLLKGTYGIAALSLDDPNILVGARLGSPLVLGLGEGECFLASDPTALAGYADKVVYLDDQQLCVLTPEYWRILNRERVAVEASIHDLETTTSDIDLGDFDHFMLKEIYEQPEALENALRGRLDESKVVPISAD